MWKKVDRRRWEADDGSLSGEASISESEGGYYATITLEDEAFDMSLIDKREFFESESAAKEFLEGQMEKS